MPKYVVTTTLLGTDTGDQEVSFPVVSATEAGALQLARTSISKLVGKGKASGHTTLKIKLADVQ